MNKAAIIYSFSASATEASQQIKISFFVMDAIFGSIEGASVCAKMYGKFLQIRRPRSIGTVSTARLICDRQLFGEKIDLILRKVVDYATKIPCFIIRLIVT